MAHGVDIGGPIDGGELDDAFHHGHLEESLHSVEGSFDVIGPGVVKNERPGASGQLDEICVGPLYALPGCSFACDLRHALL